MHRHVIALSYQHPVAIEYGAGIISPLFDIGREGRTAEAHAHLFGYGGIERFEYFEFYGIGFHSRRVYHTVKSKEGAQSCEAQNLMARICSDVLEKTWLAFEQGFTMNNTETINAVIIGGGVVGLAIAAELSRHTEDVFLIEAMPRLGAGASTRNSGVIHAGIYYPTGSLKAFHSVRGARMLFEFCQHHRVPHHRVGKLIVIDSVDEIDALHSLKRRGDENGVEGLEIIERDSIQKLEPHVASPFALWSPNTGIVEVEELLKTLARTATEQGAHILTDTRLIGVEINDRTTRLRTEREEFSARIVINAAGLYSDDVARMFGYDRHTIYPCRGEYAEVVRSRSDIVHHLVYPLPPASGHGTGVHFTKTLAGVVLVGPNARYVERKDDYEQDRAPLDSFFESASRIIPSLRREDLRLSYSGLRARLLPEHDHSFADFVIAHDPRWPTVIHAIGIESPGLTSALSIAESVSEMARSALGH